jgi:hypothetical protein
MGKIYNFNENQIHDMINLYVNEKKSTRFISEKYNVDNSVIVNRLKKNGITVSKGSAFSVKYWIGRGLSEEDAKQKIKEMKPNLVEYWLSRGFSAEESKLKTELHLMNTERSFILKYGEEDGIKLFREKKVKDGKLHSPRSIEYWINKGFSIEESKIKVSESQNKFSLVKCIEKYGEEDGKKIFTERQKKWQESLYKNGNLKSGYSKVSQDLFFDLLKYYENIEDLNYVMFAKKGGEFVLTSDEGFYRYDFTDLLNKKIIEYNGDNYHANPDTYTISETPNPFRKNITSEDIWKRDCVKIKLANKYKFDVLVIWDSEYKKNKEKVIEKCLKFLKNEN